MKEKILLVEFCFDVDMKIEEKGRMNNLVILGFDKLNKYDKCCFYLLLKLNIVCK